jgi:hypothetical protein
MGSWHELAETNPEIVTTVSGLEHLKGRRRAEILAGQPTEYRRFRKNWSFLRRTFSELIPKEGREARDLRFVMESP